ncbi:hypothetical protein D8674_032416 [Pyrus ussuriensis x Pyrus communis]|uniref:Retrotransposon gag domain-containing protein n=1 Tax=Pyrus ussuriensis x Pyrus communis TaxID=2448454 RepID=A0A5N5F1R3_9ROSA|nr:hypothetical protein D8674_032416 [Pyrus ussuriensis x Pyrus communis]
MASSKGQAVLATIKGRSLSTSFANGASIGATITPQHAASKRKSVINLTLLGTPKYAAEAHKMTSQNGQWGSSEAIARLTKTVEEKDLQITVLINRLEMQDDEKPDLKLQEMITDTIKAQYEESSHISMLYSKPYSNKIDALKMLKGYQSPKFMQFDRKGNPKQHVAHFIETCNNAGMEGDYLVKQFVCSLKDNAFDWYTDLEPEFMNSIKPRTFEDLATHAYDMELSIAHHGKKESIVDKAVWKPTKEAMKVNITPVKISTRGNAIQTEAFRDQEMRRRTLKELEEKTYPFSDSDVVAMLKDLLDKKVIDLLECRRPEEMNHTDSPRDDGQCNGVQRTVQQAPSSGKKHINITTEESCDQKTLHNINLLQSFAQPHTVKVTHWNKLQASSKVNGHGNITTEESKYKTSEHTYIENQLHTKNKNIIAASGDISGIITRSKARDLFAAASAPALTLSKEQEHLRYEPVITLASLRASRGESPRKYSESLLSDVDSSGSTTMQMNEAIAKLTRTVEEKDLQITALVNQLDALPDVKVDPNVGLVKKEVNEEEEPPAEKVEEKPKLDQATAFMGSLSIQQLQEMIASTIKTQYEGSSHDSVLYSKPYSKKNDALKMPRGYQPPKFMQFDGKGNPKQHVAHFIETCNNAGTEGDYLVKQFVRSLKRVATRAHDMELSITHHGKKEQIAYHKNDKVLGPKVDKATWKPTKEAMTVNTTPVKIPTRSKAIQTEAFRDQEIRRRTLKELEEKTYPFPDSDVVAMLKDLLDKKVIDLPECKRPEDMNRTDSPRYCKFHRFISHPTEKFFVLKDLIMKLAQKGIIELDLNDVVKSNYTTVTSGSLNSKSSPQPLGACSKTMSVKSSEVEGWTHVTPKKMHKKHRSHPQVHQSERGQSSYRQPSKLHESVEDDEVMTQRSSVAITMRDFFPKDFFNHSVKTPCYKDCNESHSKII